MVKLKILYFNLAISSAGVEHEFSTGEKCRSCDGNFAVQSDFHSFRSPEYFHFGLLPEAQSAVFPLAVTGDDTAVAEVFQ